MVSSVTTPPNRPPSSITATEVRDGHDQLHGVAQRAVGRDLGRRAGRGQVGQHRPVGQVVRSDPSQEPLVAHDADPVDAVGVGDGQRFGRGGVDVDDRARR